MFYIESTETKRPSRGDLRAAAERLGHRTRDEQDKAILQLAKVGNWDGDMSPREVRQAQLQIDYANARAIQYSISGSDSDSETVSWRLGAWIGFLPKRFLWWCPPLMTLGVFGAVITCVIIALLSAIVSLLWYLRVPILILVCVYLLAVSSFGCSTMESSRAGEPTIGQIVNVAYDAVGRIIK